MVGFLIRAGSLLGYTNVRTSSNLSLQVTLLLLLAGAGSTCIGTDWSVLCGVPKFLVASVDPKLALLLVCRGVIGAGGS